MFKQLTKTFPTYHLLFLNAYMHKYTREWIWYLCIAEAITLIQSLYISSVKEILSYPLLVNASTDRVPMLIFITTG